MLRALETRYAGCRFRSRLEARWAVFFDAAGIRWEFEPQGFLVDGTPYLPDFVLPDLDCFFEVKGSDSFDLRRLERFAQLTERTVVVAEGAIPRPNADRCDGEPGLRVLRYGAACSAYDMADGKYDMFLRCTSCDAIELMNENYCTIKDNCHHCRCPGARWLPLSKALEAARSARFEHGESPRPG